MIFALFVPSIRKIRKERSDTLNLFLTIPKATITMITATMTDQKDEIKDLEDEMGIDDNWGAELSADIVKEKTEMSIIKKMIIRFSISLGKKK